MSDKEKILLVGGGGHCRQIISVIEQSEDFEIFGIVDKRVKLNTKVLNYSICYTDKDYNELIEMGIKNAFITVGSVGDAALRKKLYDHLKTLGFSIPVICSNKALLDDYCSIGEGTIIMPGAVLNTGVTVGVNCIINTGAIVDHDCKIGNHVHIAPGVTLSGGVEIGNQTHIGTGANVIQNVKIVEDVIIGAGSVVIHDIESPGTYLGIPTRKVK